MVLQLQAPSPIERPFVLPPNLGQQDGGNAAEKLEFVQRAMWKG